MKLIIAEKPSVAQGIAKVVGATKKENGCITGNGYIVSWCLGHLIELNSPDYYTGKEVWDIEDLPIIPDKFEFSLIDNPGVKKQYKILYGLLHNENVSEVVCATDAGREGECIFRYVYNYSKCQKPVKRLWISSLEEKSIAEGMKNLQDDSKYDRLYVSGISRAKADWLIGMNLTRLYSLKYHQYKPVLSVGRVQSVVLSMIVKRYVEIQRFERKISYRIEVTVNDTKYKSEKTYESKEEAERQYRELSDEYKVVSHKVEKKTVNAPNLYDLTLLQRHANSLYGYTAQETLDVCQKLYEGRLITYPRTDSNFLTEEMEDSTGNLISYVRSLDMFKGLEVWLPNIKKVINNKKVSDHHALLPTEKIKNSCFDGEELTQKEKNILFLICSRLLVATANPRIYESVVSRISCDNILFEAKGSHVIERGYTEIEKKLKLTKERVEAEVHDVSEGDVFTCEKGEVVEVKIIPPSLYTDASLLSAMETAGNNEYDNDTEKKGIGTPATRAAAIETLVQREYIVREKKKIIPTERGIKLVSILPSALKSVKTTASWEMGLQKIEKGEVEESYFMDKIIALTRKLVENGKNEEVNTNLFRKKYEKIGDCPVCGSEVISYKKAYSCSNKECDFFIAKTIAGKNITENAAKNVLEKRKSGKISGFTNKEGEEYAAELYLNDDNELKMKYRK